MAELRKYNNSGSVAIPWKTAQDERLSFTARGVLAYVLSLPDGWKYSIERVAASCTATVKGSGREAVTSAMRELEDAGYRRVVTERDERGRVHRWAEFAFAPVPEWAEVAAAERYKRSHKTGGKCAPRPDDRTPEDRAPGTRSMDRPGETPGGTEGREPGPRQASAVRGSKRENNTHSDTPPEAPPAPTGDGVCVEPPNGAKAFVSWNITEQQLTDGTAIIETTTHPTALALLIGDDRERLEGKAAALLARGWDRRGVERALQGRTNANTFAPVRIIEPVLDKMAAAGPPAPNPRRGAAGDANERARLRGRALTVAARFEAQDDTQHGLWKLTKWIHQADAPTLKAWLAHPTPEVPK
jgi:hypothetical protein